MNACLIAIPNVAMGVITISEIVRQILSEICVQLLLAHACRIGKVVLSSVIKTQTINIFSTYFYLFFPLAADKKELGAQNKSKYYIKYGNPNYGGMKGLISTSL